MTVSIPVRGVALETGTRARAGRATRRTWWAALATLAVAIALVGISASVASAVVERLPNGDVLSYQPLRGASPPARGDLLLTDLDYNGGPVMPSNANYTLYWDPSGAPGYPGDYKAGVDQYLADLAHDSGGHGNVDSVAAQYGDATGQLAAYDSSFGGRLDDGDPYPGNGCAGVAICLTDSQIQSELDSYLAAHHLPRDLRHEYFVLTPPSVVICFDGDGAAGCSADSSVNPRFCAYHNNASVGHEFVYAVDPYVTGNAGCDDGNHPNDTTADGAIEGGLSHEHDESITDPEPNTAWADTWDGGSEIGDKCEQRFGSSFGTAPGGASYNQVVNGHLYWNQEEWSNETSSCLQRLAPDPLPSASFTAAHAGGLTMSFDAGASSAPGGVTLYDWQFNDNNNPASPPLTEETGSPTIDHVFPSAGDYTVALTVFAADGSSAGTAHKLTVADVPNAAPGWQVTSFATKFDANGSIGPLGIVANAANQLYVDDLYDAELFRFGPDGGDASDHQLSNSPLGDSPLGLAFGKDGRLYAALDGDDAVVEVDPATGAVIRSVASVPGPLGLATDPVSGDLFVASYLDGAVERISDPASPDPAVTTYASGLSVPDGISAAPDGTFYVADGSTIDRISASDSSAPGTVTPLVDVPGADGVAVGANPFNPAAPSFVVVNSNDGSLTKVDLASPGPGDTPVFDGGSRGDFVTVAPDGCLYATQSTSVVRVAGAGGTCPFAPITPFQPPAAQAAAAAGLTPSSVTLQGIVDPHGTATSFHFDWGTDASYGHGTPETDAGATDGPETVAQTVTGLTPGTTYHYRVVAHNVAGTVFGPDAVVSTPASIAGPPPPTVLASPTVAGRALPGRTLSCAAGTWRGATSFAFSWTRDAHTSIGAGSSYRVARGDVGHRLACHVVASGAGGSASADSAAVTVVSVPGFRLRLRAPRATLAALAAAGEPVTVAAPRACRVTVRLLALRVVHRRPSTRVLAVVHVRFARKGSKTLRVAPPPRVLRALRGHVVLRLAATATAGSARSRPASLTILR